jgi:hypothetical protein
MPVRDCRATLEQALSAVSAFASGPDAARLAALAGRLREGRLQGVGKVISDGDVGTKRSE